MSDSQRLPAAALSSLSVVPVPEREAPRDREPMIVFAYARLREQLDALREHQPHDGVVPQPEQVHRMRIATRRMRVALRLFKEMLPGRAAKQFRDELRWFARALGEVRDLDVYAENFRDYREAVPPEQQHELGGYELHLRRTRAEARGRLSEIFADPRREALLGDLAALLEGGPPRNALRRWRSFRVKDGTGEYLRKSFKRLRKLGRKVDGRMPAEKLHELRIRAKRFRYEIELFAGVYPKLDKAARATKELQDLLGEHQDACTASARLHDYAECFEPGSESATASALERLRAQQERKAADARERFSDEWGRFERTMRRVDLKRL
jgi:CHAD domain-containing protein